MVHCKFDLRGPWVLKEVRLTNFGPVPRASLRLPTLRSYQADLNSRCVVDEMDAGLFHRFIVSLETRRAAWHRSQGCDCVARELKLKIHLCPRILCGRGNILAWDF